MERFPVKSLYKSTMVKYTKLQLEHFNLKYFYQYPGKDGKFLMRKQVAVLCNYMWML